MPSSQPVPDLPREVAEAGRFPGAESPARTWRVSAAGVGLAVYEWGDPDAPPLFLVHGGFDFARTFSVFAPKLAAGGWRVISYDQRGHGTSDHTAFYGWEADVRDLAAVVAAVLDPLGRPPAPIVGHSKGGGLTLQIASALPHRFSAVVNLDGMPSRRPMPDVADHERQRMVGADVGEWLDYRRTTSARERKHGTLEELARRRRTMNPRLSIEWIRFLVTAGARLDPDGWRWTLDPSLRFGGFGPWRPEWTLQSLASLTIPVLGLLATEPEPLGWGTQLSDVQPFLPRNAHIRTLDGCGHFVHIEQPDVVADLVLEFLA